MRLSPWTLVATLGVAVVLTGALTFGTTGWTGATASAACGAQPCGTPTGGGTQRGGHAPSPSCVQSASCGGGGAAALAGGPTLWVAMLGGAVVALGLALAGLRRAPRRAGRLLAGIPSVLLRPPQAA